MNFCNDFLSFVKSVVKEDDPRYSWKSRPRCQITQVKWVWLQWLDCDVFSDWYICSNGIHTEMWPTPSTATLRLRSYQSGTWRTRGANIHPTTDCHLYQCCAQLGIACVFWIYFETGVFHRTSTNMDFTSMRILFFFFIWDFIVAFMMISKCT